MSVRRFVFCKGCDKVVEVGVDTGCLHGYQPRVRHIALAIYAEGPNGEIQPLSTNTDRLPKRLASRGFSLRQITNHREYSDIMRRMNTSDRAKYERLEEAKEKAFSAQEKESRAELRASLKTQFGKDFAEYAIRYYDQQYKPRYEPGNHIEGYEYDGRRAQEERD